MPPVVMHTERDAHLVSDDAVAVGERPVRRERDLPAFEVRAGVDVFDDEPARLDP